MLKFILPLVLSTALFADEITLVADSWPPYNDEPNSAKPGYAIELATEIFTKAGHKVKYNMIPWARAVAQTELGTYTAAVGAFDGDIKGAVLPKEPIGINSNTFFVKKGGAFKFTGLASLEGKSVGLIKEYTYDLGAFDAWAAKAKGVQWATGDAPLIMNIKKLAAGRLDVLLEDRNVVLYTATKLGLGNDLQDAGNLPGTNALYIAFSGKNPKSKEYAELFSKGLAEMRKSGALKKILDKYNVKDWK